MATQSRSNAAHSATVSLRMQHAARDLIDRAAKAAGKNRSEFMVEAARREAEAVLLDQRYFTLDKEQFEAFQAALDQPPQANPRLQELLRTPTVWDE